MVIKQAGDKTAHSLGRTDGKAPRSTNVGMSPGKHMSHRPEEGAMSDPTQDLSGFYRWLKSEESSVCCIH